MNELENLKVGDEVLYHPSFPRGNNKILKVTGITKTLIKCNSMSFRKSDGYKPGINNYECSYISIPTQEDYDRMEKRRLIRLIKNELGLLQSSLSIDMTKDSLEEIEKDIKNLNSKVKVLKEMK